MRLRLRARRSRSAAAETYARTSFPSLGTPWREARYAVVDLETTGLDPRRDEIISFASLPIEQGRVMIGRLVSGVVRPRRMPEAETSRIHGFRPIDLETAPPLPELVDELVEALAGRVLVAHTAWVERGFLTRALKLARIKLRNPIIDTAVMSRRTLGEDRMPDSTPTRLAREARRLGLPVHRPHHADGDALTTAQLFIALASRLDRNTPQTVGSLLRVSRT